MISLKSSLFKDMIHCYLELLFRTFFYKSFLRTLYEINSKNLTENPH